MELIDQVILDLHAKQSKAYQMYLLAKLGAEEIEIAREEQKRYDRAKYNVAAWWSEDRRMLIEDLP